MGTCDVCNEETSFETGTTYTAEEFRKLVSKGFKPEDGAGRAAVLALAKATSLSEHQAYELVVKEAGTDGWLLCPSCAARASKIMPKPARTGGGRDKLTESLDHSARAERLGMVGPRHSHTSGPPAAFPDTTLVSISDNPVPDGVVSGTLKTRDGVTLRFARWAPPPECRGTVCLFQDRGEFIEKYFETVRDLRARGFAVATLDWRGQGLSARTLRNPRKGYVRSFAQYQIDLETFVNEVVVPDCPPPVFALAHSMGATVLLRAAHAGHRWFDRMVLLAPMIALSGMRGSAASRVLVRSLRLLGLGALNVPGRDAADMQQRPLVDNLFTSDPVRYARNVAVLEAEPGLAIGAPTVAWSDAAFRAVGGMAEPGYAGSIRQPILIIGAGRDRIVSTPAIDIFSAQLRAGSGLIIRDARHDLLMEADRFRSQVWAAFDAFVPGKPLFGATDTQPSRKPQSAPPPPAAPPPPRREPSAPQPATAVATGASPEQTVEAVLRDIEKLLKARADRSLPIISLRIREELGAPCICWHFRRDYRGDPLDTDAAQHVLSEALAPYGFKVFYSSSMGSDYHLWEYVRKPTNDSHEKQVKEFDALRREPAVAKAQQLLADGQIELLVAWLRSGEYCGIPAEVLRNCNRHDAAETIISLLADPSSEVRRRAAIALGPLGGVEAAKALCAALPGAKERAEYWGLAGAIGRLAWPGAVSALTRANVDSHDSTVRAALAGALVRCGDVNNGLNILYSGLSDDAGSNDHAATLGRLDEDGIRDARLVPAMRALLERTKNNNSREIARKIIGRH
jgi:lysophospholipase